MRYFLLLLAGCTVVFFFAGCSHYTGDFVKKSEEELACMEKSHREAARYFEAGDYATSGQMLLELIRERTVYLPLYRQELISSLLMQNPDQGKTDEPNLHTEAMKYMIRHHNEWEIFFNPDLEDSRENQWCGNEDDVYVAAEYERAFFYLLMTLTAIEHGRYGDALRSIKYGLGTCNGMNMYQKKTYYTSDNMPTLQNTRRLSMFYYLGYLAAKNNNEKQLAESYFKKMIAAVSALGFPVENVPSQNCYENLKNTEPNVIVTVWSGEPVFKAYDLETDEEVFVRGRCSWDMLSLSVDHGKPFYFPPHFGDLWLHTVSSASVADGKIINREELVEDTEENYPFLRNIPGQLNILPLKLTPGKHRIFLSGHNRLDRGTLKIFEINVVPGHINVIHLPLKHKYKDLSAIRTKHWKAEWKTVTSKVDQADKALKSGKKDDAAEAARAGAVRFRQSTEIK